MSNGNGGPDVTVQSYSMQIRDGLLSRAKLVPPFTTCAKFGRSVARTIQPEQIPYLGLYFVDEKLSPDGDANHAEPRFLHALKLGFSYLVQNNDSDDAEDILDAAHWSLMKLLHDPAWHTFPSGAKIESIVGGQRSHHFGNIGTGGKNEIPVAEMRMELDIRHRTYFEPIITDMFALMHVTTVYPYPEDPNRMPIISEWVIPTT